MYDNKYDVIIIWSGLGWLSAGAILSQKGKDVLVLEKHYLFWWYATNFKRKDYEFDVALHQIGWLEKTGFKNLLKNIWVLSKLKLIKHKYLYEAIYPDFELKVENWNVWLLKNDLIKLFPNESFGIKLWFFMMAYIWFQIRIWDFGQRNKFFYPFIMFFAPLLIPILAFGSNLKISTLLNKCTNDKKLQKIFMELIGYYWDDLNLSAIYYMVPSYWYYFDWWYYVYGWGQAVSDSFIDVIKSKWWELINNCEVQEIIYQWDSAIWVKTRKWEYYADTIICNASPFILYEKLLKNNPLSEKEIQKLSTYEIWPSITSVYIWLNTTIENLNPRFKDSYIVTINENYEISFEKNNNIWFTITDNNHNKNIPVWKTVLTVALFEKYSQWDNLKIEEYKQKKKEKTELLITRLEKYFPKIRDFIDVIEYGTPKTMEKYTWNKNWAVYWFSKRIWNEKKSDYWYNTYLENVYLSSARSFGWWFEWVIRAWNEVCKKIK